MSAKLALHGGMPYIPDPLIKGFFTTDVENPFGPDEKAEIDALFERGGKGARRLFEEQFAAAVGAKHGIACNSCTSALHIATRAAGVGPGDEVIVGCISDISTACCALAENAIPIFADVKPDTFCADPEDVARKITDKTRLILVIHLFGDACDMDPIMETAREHGIPVIEDCAQAHLARYRGRCVGALADLGCFSFLGSKHMTTGGHGGMITTHSDEYAEKCRAYVDLRGCSMAPREEHRGLPYRYHDYLGLCYRMTELDAAFGLAQLRKLPRWVQQRREAAHLLDELLTDVEGVRPAPIDAQVEHSYWLYPILLDLEQFDGDVYDFAAALCAEGVSGMPKEYFLLYDMPIYQNQTAYAHSHCPWDCPAYGRSVEYHHGLCPNAEDVLARAIALTWHHRLTERDVRLMAGAIRKVADYYRRSA